MAVEQARERVRERREAAAQSPTFGNLGFMLLLGGGVAIMISVGAAFLASQYPTSFVTALELKPGNLLLFGAVAAVLGYITQMERIGRSRRRARGWA